MSAAGDPVYRCPFCGGETPGPYCTKCGRQRNTSRRVCHACSELTPKDEVNCCHCGEAPRNELAWKIPAIIVMFVVAIGLSILLRVGL